MSSISDQEIHDADNRSRMQDYDGGYQRQRPYYDRYEDADDDMDNDAREYQQALQIQKEQEKNSIHVRQGAAKGLTREEKQARREKSMAEFAARVAESEDIDDEPTISTATPKPLSWQEDFMEAAEQEATEQAATIPMDTPEAVVDPIEEPIPESTIEEVVAEPIEEPTIEEAVVEDPIPEPIIKEAVAPSKASKGKPKDDLFIKTSIGLLKGDVFSELDAPSFKTLMALSAYMNSKGECFPSQETLAERLRINRQAVSKHITKLLNYRTPDGLPILESRKIKVDGMPYARLFYKILPASGLSFG